jgi:ribosomal protein S13
METQEKNISALDEEEIREIEKWIEDHCQEGSARQCVWWMRRLVVTIKKYREKL